MKRTDAVKFHTQEAAAARNRAAGAPGTPGGRELLAQARDHESMADAARLGDYPEDLED